MSEKQILERRGYGPGEMIFKQGDSANVAFVVQTGEVEIFITNEEDEEQVLGNVGKGGIFGEMALMDDSRRMASARAVQQSSLIVVSRAAFRKKLDTADPFIRGLLNIFIDRVRTLASK